MLILVRHAMPAFTPEIPADAWDLGDEGRGAAQALSRALLEVAPDAVLVASTEVKAWQTLAAAGPVVRDARFNEVSRVEPWEGEYRRLRRTYVDGVDHAGWESRTAVAERFGAAVTDHREAARGRPLIIATHGMAMTVWLTAAVGLADTGEFWADLRFPDAHRVDLARRSVTRITG